MARSAAFWPCAHPLTFHLVELDASGNVERVRASADSDIWTNAGYFVFTNRIIDYIKEGEELVIEPFQRLITKGNCSPTATTVFSRPMDTLKDKQILDDAVERGDVPWQLIDRAYAEAAE